MGPSSARVGLAVAFALLAGGCAKEEGGGAPSAAKTQAAKEPQGGPSGEELFKSTCAACHGPDARGLPNLGKNLTTSQFVDDRTSDQLVEFLKVGRPSGDPLNTTGVAMPPKGGNPALTDAQLRAIAQYVKGLPQAP
jgi:disulfide bond formation protein DsbB